MNINQWIESLEQAVPPNESPLPTDKPHAPLKRERGSRTSSLLEPLANRKRRGTKDKQPVVSVDSSSSVSSDATSTSTSSRPSSQPSSSSSKRYRRRPRYHTKEDKYHSKSSSKPQQKRREKKKKKKKEKEKEKDKRAKHSRRNKHKSKEVTGVVQTFKAKNVPKDRLTVSCVLCLLLMTIAEAHIHSLTQAPSLGCIPKVVRRAPPRVKAVSHKKPSWVFEC